MASFGVSLSEIDIPSGKFNSYSLYEADISNSAYQAPPAVRFGLASLQSIFLPYFLSSPNNELILGLTKLLFIPQLPFRPKPAA